MRVFTLFVLLCGLCGVSGSVRAQDAANGKPKSVFLQLFPNPTGENGFEELMLAGDLARGSKAFNDAMQSDTLTDKRKTLEDPDIRRVLSLISAAFVKPIHSPRDPAKLNYDSRFPDLAEFRNLARLLSIVEYVALADGKTGVALDAMEDCLRLSRALPKELILSALVSVAVDSIAIKLIAIHITQLSFRDCERLELICDNWLRTTDSAALAFVGERNVVAHLFPSAPQPDDLLKLIDNGPPDDKEATPEEKALRARLTERPEDAKIIWQQAEETMQVFYDGVIEEAGKNTWERKPVAMPKAEPAVRALTDGVTPIFSQVLSKADQDKANLHLLGTFAALQHYHWIHRHYPATLRELREPILTQDPFTGELLIYKRDGDAYDLHSAGAIDAETKTRTPLYLPYRKN